MGWEGERWRTGGVARVDHAEHTWAAAVTCLGQRTPQLSHIECPGLLLIQVIVHLHRVQFRQSGGIERVLRDGDEHACTPAAFTSHQQLQHRLGRTRSTVLAGQGAAPIPHPVEPQTKSHCVLPWSSLPQWHRWHPWTGRCCWGQRGCLHLASQCTVQHRHVSAGCQS